MSNANKINSGMLICGGCAICADSNSNEPSSIELLGHAIKSLFTRPGRRAMTLAASKTQ